MRFHDMRHTPATLLRINSINAKAVSVGMGHSSIAITLDTYSHFLPETDMQTVQVVWQRLFGS